MEYVPSIFDTDRLNGYQTPYTLWEELWVTE
jgi:hypothetical protein